MSKETRIGLTLAPSMRLKLTITECENTTIGDLRRICLGIESVGYKAEMLPTEIKPQAILVKR